MGYTTKDIALVFEPEIVSLSGQPNFVQFRSKPGTKTYLEANITIQINAATPGINWPIVSSLRIVEPSGVVHEFHGTTVAADVAGTTYFISASQSDTAENLRQALLSDKWVNANFSVRIPPLWTAGVISNGRVINLKSKGAGDEYEISIAKPGDPTNIAYTVAFVQATSTNADSISGEASTVQVSLDVYTDAPIFLGADDRPLNSALLGNFAVTLSKTYSGGDLWFDVNGPFSKAADFAVPARVPGWFDPKTVKVSRFVARIEGVNNYPFYISNALYTLRGYDRLSDPINLGDYTYLADPVQLLTRKPRTVYVKGQREYLNFIFSDPDRGVSGTPNWTVQVLYRAYDTLGNFLGQITRDPVNRTVLTVANTCVLRIDELLAAFPKTGLVRVALARGAAIISSDLEYEVRPSSLHSVQQFSFLNSLGGWDSFNFDAPLAEDVKIESETFSRTYTPGFQKGKGVQTVYATQADRTTTVTGAPVTDAVAKWLSDELAASTVVLDSEGNYIIKSELTIPVSEGNKNMHVPTMKYKFSEYE